MDPRPMSVTMKPVTASTAASVRSVAAAALRDSQHAESLLAALDAALAGASDEHRAIVALHDGGVVGLIVFGETAGALGAGRISLVAVDASARDRGVAAQLVAAVCDDLAASGARFAMMELPGEPGFAPVHRLAVRMGFREQGRIDDYLRDGVPLILLRRDLAPTRSDAAS